MTEEPNHQAIDWPAIRTRYEQGTEPVKSIAESIGMQHTKLSLYAKAQG